MLRHKQRVFSECAAAESGIGGDIGGKCTDDCACMDCGVCLLESHEKDTARKFKTVSGVRIINMCFDYMFFSSLFISGLSSSNKGIAASRGKRDRG